MSPIRRLAVPALLCLVGVGPAAAAEPGLFVPATAPVGASLLAVDGTPSVRSAALMLDVAAFNASESVPGDVWSMNIFDDVNLAGLIGSVEQRHGATTVMGDILSDDGAERVGTFVASVVGEAMTMAAWLDEGTVYEVRPAADGSLVARELDSPAFPDCATGAEHHVDAGHAHEQHPGAAARGGCSDDGSVLDVLVVYTPTARNASGGTNGITSLINSAVASSNNSYNNSDIPTSLNLVHIAEVDYSESGFSTDLGRLRSSSDGFMDEVHALRNQHNADFVALISAGSGSCGIGYLMTNLSVGFQSSAFTVTRYSCAVGNLTFAHELGHNMGCTHDRDNGGNALYSYSYGHRWVSANNGVQYRSVMSYSPGIRIPHFSNPDIDYRGTPTGIPQGQSNSADNARSISNALSTIAQWRLAGTAPEVIAAPESQSADAGDTVEMSVTVTGEDLTYFWFRNDAPLFDDGRISGSNTANLTIANVSSADTGAYNVAVTNNCGGVFSDPGTLTVNVSCPADLAAPFGTLNFFDVSEFIALYNAGDPSADLASPFGTLNFFDVSEFIAAYNAGCP